MNRLISSIILFSFLFMTPVHALALASPYVASDGDTVVALEIKLFAHPDGRRSMNERVSKLELFVFGKEKTGDIHNRINALGTSVAAPPEKAAAPCDREKQIAQARSQLHPAVNVPPASIVPSRQPKISYVPQIVIPKQARVQTVVTVVDRIESLELDVFGRRECAKKLQLRVSRLEKCLLGDDYGSSDDTITHRVNRLWFAYIGIGPNT